MQGKVKDYLWLNLKDLPYFRAILRAVEARFYQDIPLEPPVFDLGCGDGHFASIAFEKPLEAGLDPWRKPLVESASKGAYKIVLQGNGAQLPFPDNHFSTVISNSVLEHIEGIDAVIAEVSRILPSGGIFVFCVPNNKFTKELSFAKFLQRIGLKRMANSYRNWFNKISRHYHCDPPEIWEERLSNNKFVIERYWHYFSPKALSVLEWGHYFGLPSLVAKTLFGKWILMKRRWNFGLIEKYLRSLYNAENMNSDGCYTFYVARRQ